MTDGPKAKPGVPVKRRVFFWALMASAVAWTLVYQLAQKDSDLPEFVYVNF